MDAAALLTRPSPPVCASHRHGCRRLRTGPVREPCICSPGTTSSSRLTDYFAIGSTKIETLQIGTETFSIAAQLAGPVTTGGRDTVGSFLGNTLIEGQGGNDRITDLYGSNTLGGGSGNDRLTTGAGNDVLTGGTGRDVLIAGAGNDRLGGGAKADRLTGERGADQFAFARGTGADVVTDFGTGADVLALDSSLWAGRLTARQVVNRFATDTGDDVVFDFGARGEITLDGLGSLRGLAGDIDIV